LELPAVAGLLSRCLVAGETLRAALDRVADAVTGVWGEELRRMRDEVRQGAPLADALGSLRDRLDVVPAARLIETLQLARERGVPVAAALRAQADDVRSAATRRLIEAAGKRQ